jgi:hypothetical protein
VTGTFNFRAMEKFLPVPESKPYPPAKIYGQFRPDLLFSSDRVQKF